MRNSNSGPESGIAPGKYLIVGPSWVGDMVMAQSLFRQLKANHPDNEISVLAPDWTRPLLERMPEVEQSLDSPFRRGEWHWDRRREFGRGLRQRGFTHAIVLPNSFKSALVPFHAGIPRRTGWRGEWRGWLLNDCRRLNKEKLPRMVERFVALGLPPDSPLPAELPRPRLQVREPDRDQALARLKLDPQHPVLALCPGAEFGPSKQWPAAGHGELARDYLARGWQLWLFGSENDRGIAAEIIAGIGDEWSSRCRDLTGETSLAEAIDLLSLAGAVVSNDSGLMHVAAALDRPLAAIYGSSSPKFTPPLAERVELLVTGIECQPCYQRECPYGHLRCLTGIQPELVAGAIERLRGQEPAP